eukprot:GHVS01099059.1.p1 GENE.GHVS01099059.1~~GHVS01099059.1.p1  ORF type:complete len:163 (-),score=45.26 GHVS01099059.1:80-568(-)
MTHFRSCGRLRCRVRVVNEKSLLVCGGNSWRLREGNVGEERRKGEGGKQEEEETKEFDKYARSVWYQLKKGEKTKKWKCGTFEEFQQSWWDRQRGCGKADKTMEEPEVQGGTRYQPKAAEGRREDDKAEQEEVDRWFSLLVKNSLAALPTTTVKSYTSGVCW